MTSSGSLERRGVADEGLLRGVQLPRDTCMSALVLEVDGTRDYRRLISRPSPQKTAETVTVPNY